MARNLLTLIGIVVALLVAGAAQANPVSAAEMPCSKVQILSGGCKITGEVKGPGVDLTGEQRQPGGRVPGSREPGTAKAGKGAGNGAAADAPSGDGAAGGSARSCESLRPGCMGHRDGYTVTRPETPGVTLRDLVNFRPTPGVDRMEPNGWMVVGLDTNFFAEVGQQVHSGQLLGRPAEVRFTPRRYHWSYGDGTRADLSVKGSTWAAQGVSEFEPTPTSHVYRAAGTYYIDLGIDFSAEYRWADGPWTSLVGTIQVPANRLVAVAGGAKTVLVERDCTVLAGPGC